MPSLDDLKKRIKSVKSTQKITKAMKMVAAAKLRKAQDSAEKGRPYSEKMQNIILNLTRSISDPENAPKLLAGTGKDKVHLCVVMTSDRGLCGGFNSNIIKKAKSYFAKLSEEGKDLKIVTVGSKGNDQLKRVYGSSYPEVYNKSLPDTLVWRDKLGYNEPYVTQYLRHPAYDNYPVVGVSWTQANDFCVWRTDRVNERILINEGILKEDPEQIDDNTFNTEAYLAGQYDGIQGRLLRNYDPSTGEKFRKVKMEDGILLPKYRLPTEAEWEFAALGYVGNTTEENVTDRKIFPWNGASLRNSDKNNQGEIMANFKRGRGDNMGVAGNLNDNADITTDVRHYWPNDYGLYNMAGNVSEWVLDVYRPVTEQTSTTDHRPFRGNVYQTPLTDEDGFLAEKDSLGRMIMVDVDVQENAYRRNYKKADNINYLDGDIESQMGIDWNNFLSEKSDKDTSAIKLDKWNTSASKYKDPAKTGNSSEMYDYGGSSLITDRTRVYKGGSWKDRAYWLNPGTRRFLDQDQSSDAIGFRCAMDRVGAPKSNYKENQRRGVDYSKK